MQHCQDSPGLSLLSPRSRSLSTALFDFLEGLPTDAKRAGPFQPILRLLLRMGLRTEDVQRLVGDPTLEGPYRRRLTKLVQFNEAPTARELSIE